MASYHVGDYVRLRVTFYVSDIPTDPTTVSLSVMQPDGVTTTYTYAAGQITRQSAGVYYRDIALAGEGWWQYRWVGAGAVAAADEGWIQVAPTDMA